MTNPDTYYLDNVKLEIRSSHALTSFVGWWKTSSPQAKIEERMTKNLKYAFPQNGK